MQLFFDPTTPLGQAALLIFGFLLLRYTFIAGGAYLLFWKVLNKKLLPKKIDPRPAQSRDIYRELKWSLATFVVFALNGTFIIWATRKGWTQFTAESFSEIEGSRFFLSVIAMLAFHDLYFYIIHRSMHHRALYRTFHEVHHRSLSPTPWAAFNFHPLEAIVESGVVTFIAFLFPVHLYALFLFQLISLVMNVYGHLGYEFIEPTRHERHPILRWLNTTRSHHEHHRKFRSNFGLYTLFWDRILGTYCPVQEKLNRAE